MGAGLARAFPEAAGVFREADEVLGFSISGMAFEGSDEELRRTENTQPAILTASVAAWRVLDARGLRPDYVAGHSLGEYSALVAAGGILFPDAVAVVRKRGRYMQEAVPEGVGGMAAILGLDPESVRRACEAAGHGEVVEPANFNSPAQVVIAGHREAVERAATGAKAMGAKRAVMLPVSAPFHSSLMKPAEERLRAELGAIGFRDLGCPLVTNVDARPVTGGPSAREALGRQPSSPVRWEESMRFLLDSGVDTFVEIGPGKVLSGLLRSIEKSVTMHNAEDEDSVHRTLSALVAS
jgi:[acyl-carrier-protein] S-malonyltransferase